jgi:hypothetical protein
MAPVAHKRGTFTIPVDGKWDIEDLRALSEALSETYGMFYPLVVTDEQAAERVHGLIQKRFWSGDMQTRHLGKILYEQIPDDDALKLKSFNYASPGTVELLGILSVLWAAARCTRAWTAAGSELLDLWKKADAFFEKRKSLQKAAKKTALDDEMKLNVDEARLLAFQIGQQIGFNEPAVERIIAISGNPITALKYMIAIANEARKIADLENAGLLKMPEPPDDFPLVLGPSTGRRTKGGVKVTTLKSRGRKTG